ncbi:hypothetical protein ABZ605_32800 [Streptomyces sp. NPDC012765]|uniref:hypothetical protein n=1 Tax=Streptomyces sp. NPDC012765 TaxID=3155249 RepID=UPI0033F0C538
MSVTFFVDSAGEGVNLANSNAARVLGVLGYDELAGDAEADDFLGRVLVALALTPEDAGRPATAEGRFVDCGRRVGYVQERLEELYELAEEARARGLTIYWG